MIDQAKWRRLVNRIARRLRLPADAEDHLQEAFIRVEQYRKKASVRSEEALLVRVAANLGRDDERRSRRLQDEPAETLLRNFLCDAPIQDEVLEARQRLERANAGLMRLSPRTREVFLLHRVDGLKHREIAARLGISTSAVEKHVAKAALHLAEWMEGW
jgi:RNA polymerase sigma-70 factor (ECF subfamily)